ncbi:tetratricopeptide repeat protein, partial [Thermodesulfobacteriota bacterium]
AEEDGGRAYFDFGVFAYEDGDYDDAEKNLKKAYDINPENPLYSHYLGKTYVKLERYDEAGRYLDIAWDLNPDITGLKYDRAYLFYKIENYSKAVDLFQDILEADPSNVFANYHAGISLYKLKSYGKALKYLNIAADLSPTIKANGYYYAGICHLKMGDIEKATKKFEYVRDHAKSASLKEYALKWLNTIAKQKKVLKPYSLYLKMGYQYDNNVKLEPLNQDLYSNEDDYMILGYFSGSYSFVNGEKYKAGGSYSHYQTRHKDLWQYDLVGSIFNIYGKYRSGPLTFSLSYLPHYYWLDSKSYLMRHQVKPEVTWKIGENIVSKFTYSHYRNNYLQDNNSDGHTNEVFLNTYYTIGEKRGQLFGGIGYEINTASHPDKCYGQFKAKTGISIKIPWDFHLVLSGKYYEKHYDNIDSIRLVERKNAKYEGSASLSHRLIYDWLSVTGELNYSKNDSNVNDYRYKRKVATLSLIAKF